MRYRSGADRDTRPIELSPQEDERWRALLDGPVVSLHDHPVRLPAPLDSETWAAHVATRHDRLAETELLRSPLDLVLASALSDPNLDNVLSWARHMNTSIDCADQAMVSLRAPLDGARPTAAGSVTVGLALEDLGAVGTDLSVISVLHSLGIRSAGIAYNDGSALGGGLAEPYDGGLTLAGIHAISLMNDIGMAVDVSHAGDRTAVETAQESRCPIFITHAGSRSVWPSDRMKPDSVLRAVAATGGLIGIEAAPGSTRTRLDSSDHNIDDMIVHLEYCAELLGVEHVALGPDTFYGDHVGLYQAAGWGVRQTEGAVPMRIQQVTGADNPSETPRQVCAGLIRRGWSDQQIAMVLGRNALRALEVVLSAQ